MVASLAKVVNLVARQPFLLKGIDIKLGEMYSEPLMRNVDFIVIEDRKVTAVLCKAWIKLEFDDDGEVIETTREKNREWSIISRAGVSCIT